MQITDIMTIGAATCAPSANLAQAAELLWKNDCGIIPIVDDRRRVLGVVTDRDVAIALGTRNRRASDMHVDEVMTKKVYACLPDDDAKQALAIMHARRVRRLPVVGHDGELRGIVSIDDMFRVATPSGDVSFAGLANVMKRLCERSAEEPVLAGAR
jgi:CBS domain-containing protein